MENESKRGKFRLLRPGKSSAWSRTEDELPKKAKKDQAKKKLTSYSNETTPRNAAETSLSEESKKKRKTAQNSKSGQRKDPSKSRLKLSSETPATSEIGRTVSKKEDIKNDFVLDQVEVMITPHKAGSIRAEFDATSAKPGENSATTSALESSLNDGLRMHMKVPACTKVSSHVRLTGTVNPQIMRLVSEQQSLDLELFYDDRACRTSSIHFSPKLASLSSLSAAKIASEDKWRGLVKDQLSPKYAPTNSLISFDSSSRERKVGHGVNKKSDFGETASDDDDKASERSR